MNAKADEWEHYTDGTGRRHWRWPASEARDVRLRLAGQHRNVSLPEPARARENPTRDRGR
jgi:hypothetical protein